jgi:hypothetical protein
MKNKQYFCCANIFFNELNNFTMKQTHVSHITHYAFLILCFLISFKVNAQNPNYFFSEASDAEAQLNSNEKKLMTNVQSVKHNKSVKVIKMKKLKEALLKDVLTISVQGEDIFVQSESFEYRGKDDFTWSGKLKKRDGYMLIVSKPEGYMGAIQYDDKFFLIQPLKNGFCILV